MASSRSPHASVGNRHRRQFYFIRFTTMVVFWASAKFCCRWVTSVSDAMGPHCHALCATCRGLTHVAYQECSLAMAPERDWFVCDPEAATVPGLTQDRNLRSERRCSMRSAIHTNSRSSLRPSSTCEPSDPQLRDMFIFRLRKSAHVN